MLPAAIYNPRRRGVCFLLHLALDFIQQTLQLILSWILHRPPNAQSLLLIRLRNHMHMDVVYLLVRQSTIVLKDVVVLGATRGGNLLCYREELRQGVIGYVG